MKKKWFLILFILVLVFMGCKDPVTDETSNSNTSQQQGQEQEAQQTQQIQPEQQQQQTEDKSPYEYVLPSGVDYSDYTYVGDYIFSDAMDFVEWKYTNGEAFSEYGYFLVLEKKCRVYLEEGKMGFWRYDPKTDVDFEMQVGTKYKVYLKNDYLAEKTVSYDAQGYGRVFSHAAPSSFSYDCSNLQVWVVKDSDPAEYFVSTRTDDYDELNSHYIEK